LSSSHSQDPNRSWERKQWLGEGSVVETAIFADALSWHSSIVITLDLYSHVMPGMQDDAVAKVDAALQAALNKSKTK